MFSASPVLCNTNNWGNMATLSNIIEKVQKNYKIKTRGQFTSSTPPPKLAIKETIPHGTRINSILMVSNLGS